MQARYRHQVADAGAPEYPPLLCGNGVLFADGERDQDTTVWLALQSCIHPFSNGEPDTIDPSTRAGDKLLAQCIAAARTYVAGGADISLQRPRFKVETVGTRCSFAIYPTFP